MVVCAAPAWPVLLTAVEAQLIVEVIELLLNLLWARAVLPHTEGQQHVDLKS